MAQDVVRCWILAGPPRWDIILHQHDSSELSSRPLRFTLGSRELILGSREVIHVVLSTLVSDSYHRSSAYFIAGREQQSMIDFVGHYDLHSRKGWLDFFKTSFQPDPEDQDQMELNTAYNARLLLELPVDPHTETLLRLALTRIEHRRAVQKWPGADPDLVRLVQR